MSASNTTVPAVKAKLLALFKAAVEESTEVWPARTNEEHQLAENVYLGEVRGDRAFKVLMGGGVAGNAREEHYRVMVELEVYHQGADIAGTEARMWEIGLALERAVAERPTLDKLASIQSAIAENFSQSTKATSDGFLAAYSFGVAVTARV